MFTTWGLCILFKSVKKKRERGRKKTCWWLNNVFILRAVRNTYSVGTRRIGSSLALDQIINMQRIITKWCVVRQNCVKCIMNWYAWCLRSLFFFSSPLLQHQDTSANNGLLFFSSLLMMKRNGCRAIRHGLSRRCSNTRRHQLWRCLEPPQCEDGTRRKVLDSNNGKEFELPALFILSCNGESYCVKTSHSPAPGQICWSLAAANWSFP